MKNFENNKVLLIDFIETIWNKQRFNQIEEFIHRDFVDHSLPPSLSGDVRGLIQWITETSSSFEHKTLIEEHVNEGNKSIVKFRMLLKHIGVWRGIEATGATIAAVGYRYFRFETGKIIEHWALVDGNAIENQLKESAHGCKRQE